MATNQPIRECDGCGAAESNYYELITPEDSSGIYCEACVTECEECNYYYRTIRYHQLWCASCDCRHICEDSYYEYCEDCDTYSCEDTVCNCYDSRGNEYVHNYSWQPRAWMPKGNIPTECGMGIELEVSGRVADIVECVRAIDCSEDHLFMKEDGSVQGVEIIAHPATLSWNESFDWEELLSRMESNGAYIEPSDNGMHIHVGRVAFHGRLRHSYQWLLFLYRNKDELLRLGGRDENSWAQWRVPRRGELLAKAAGPYSDDKYLAVNTNHRDTYELRFPAATLDPIQFRIMLELIDATVEYTRQLSASDVMQFDGLHWHQFVSWVLPRGDRTLSRYSTLAGEFIRNSISVDLVSLNGGK